MDETQPRRPWWKRKRWWAAALLWLGLPVAYVLSLGPATYCIRRGWVEAVTLQPVYRPLIAAFSLAGN